jgi:chromate transport protein ChrA
MKPVPEFTPPNSSPALAYAVGAIGLGALGLFLATAASVWPPCLDFMLGK